MKSDLINLLVGCLIGALSVVVAYLVSLIVDASLTIRFVSLLFIIVSLLFTQIINILDNFKHNK